MLNFVNSVHCKLNSNFDDKNIFFSTTMNSLKNRI